MTTPGPGVLSTARFTHGAAPVAREQTVRCGLSDIDSRCPPANETHREAGCNCPTRCNIPLTGHQGHEEVTGTLGRIRLVDGPADGEAFRPAARRFEPALTTSKRAADRPSALVNAPESLAWLCRISTELLGALSAWASPLSEIFRQRMRQGKAMSQAIHDAHSLVLLLAHHRKLSRNETIEEAVRNVLPTPQTA
ncbi:hypothetical protein [Streptomyces sp. Tu102]|uniref:hypothetical protein n=1 Tax=Streptomyces sp. Tu102 TaxID=2838019 RepID=UPI001BDBE13F|nr:hypothetical protein [Streptomyces sp. Tu102]MBT1096114.1 hypothetical protein [Streptomyces sp. Tu102]